MHTRSLLVTDDFGNQVSACRGGMRCMSAFCWHPGGVLSLMSAMCADV